MERYTLNDLEVLTGIKAETIRIWERRYGILIAHRTATNRRWYTDEDLKRIINISILYQSGYKISKIAILKDSELAEKTSSIADSSLHNTHIESLIVAMMDLNENSVNEILLRSIINAGFEETFTGVVFPFLKRVGVMWHTGAVNIGAEHFISNIFRRRLISSIDALPPPVSPERKRIIMYLPENEMHEMGLLFYAYLLRRNGHEVIYLGQSTPLNAVSEVNEKWHSDLIITGALSGLPFKMAGDYMADLISAFPDQQILVSGSLADAAGNLSLPNVFALRSVNDLMSIVKHVKNN
jgi:DNA-binding transcriptional MerR regulator